MNDMMFRLPITGLPALAVSAAPVTAEHLDQLSGGHDVLRQDLEEIISSGARETANRIALRCAVHAQEVIEEERRSIRSQQTTPRSCSFSTAAVAVQGSERQRLGVTYTSPRSSTAEASGNTPRTPRSPRTPRTPRISALQGLSTVNEGALDIKAKVHVEKRSASSSTPGCGEALRSSVINVRNVVCLAATMFNKRAFKEDVAAKTVPEAVQEREVCLHEAVVPVEPTNTCVVKEKPTEPEVQKVQERANELTDEEVDRHRAKNEDLVRLLEDITQELKMARIIGNAAEAEPPSCLTPQSWEGYGEDPDGIVVPPLRGLEVIQAMYSTGNQGKQTPSGREPEVWHIGD